MKTRVERQTTTSSHVGVRHPWETVLLFHLVQHISLHFKLTDLYSFCTTKVFPKFLLPFQSQASFQSEQFGSYDFAALSLSLVACSLTSQRSRMLMQKRPLLPPASRCHFSCPDSGSRAEKRTSSSSTPHHSWTRERVWAFQCPSFLRPGLYG